MPNAADDSGSAPLSSREPINTGGPFDHYRIDTVLGRSPYVSTWTASADTGATPEEVVLKRYTRAYASLIGDRVALDALLTALQQRRGTLLPGIINPQWNGDQLSVAFAAVGGEPLDQAIAGGLEPTVARALVGSLAQGVQALHSGRLLHLGLTPTALRVDRGSNAVRMIDWGLMVPLDQRGRSGRPFPGVGLDAAAYTSSEVLAGAHADVRDDVYATGCIAYELLTGAHPYGRRTAHEAAQLQLQPPAIPALEVEQSVELARAVHPDRSKRAASLHALAKAFGEHPSRRPIIRIRHGARQLAARPALIAHAAGIAVFVSGLAYAIVTTTVSARHALSAAARSESVAVAPPPRAQPEATVVPVAPEPGPSRSLEDGTTALNGDVVQGSTPSEEASTGSQADPTAGSPTSDPAVPGEETASHPVAEAASPLRDPGDPRHLDTTELLEAPAVPVAAEPRTIAVAAAALPEPFVPPRPAREVVAAVAPPQCPTCDCTSLEYKRTFTTDPMRPEEVRFLEARCVRR